LGEDGGKNHQAAGGDKGKDTLAGKQAGHAGNRRKETGDTPVAVAL
jgi:hypothetical protein